MEPPWLLDVEAASLLFPSSISLSKPLKECQFIRRVIRQCYKMGVLHKRSSILYYTQHGGLSYFMENVNDPIVNVLFIKTEQQN